MQFNKVSIAEFISILIFSATAIIFALSGFGIWSLVIAYIFRTLVYLIMIWIFAKWRPRFEFDKKVALEMFHFGKFIFLGAVVWFLKMNFDKLLIGKLLGTTLLGLYAIAFNITNFGSEYFSGKVSRVIFPAYSKIQSDLDDLRSAFLKVLKYISIFSLPLGLGIYLLGADFLRFAFGEKWVGAIPILRILAWAGIFATLSTGIVPIFLACGKPKLSFWITSLQVGLFSIFITPAAKLFGINGVAMVVTLSSFIAMILCFFWVMKLLSLNLQKIYFSLRPSLISSLLMALGIIFFKNILPQFQIEIFSHYNLILIFFFAIALYSTSLFRIEKPLFREIKELVFS